MSYNVHHAFQLLTSMPWLLSSRPTFTAQLASYLLRSWPLFRSFTQFEHQWHALQEEVSGANSLVDQLQAALKEAQASNSISSAELVAGLQAELERQAGVIGELRTQLRASTEAQEDLRRQTVSLVEAQAHMAQQNIVEGPPAGVARMQAHLLEKVTALLPRPGWQAMPGLPW